MKVFVCGSRYEEIMTCIYDAWACALTEGHDQVRIERRDTVRPNLIDEFIYTLADEEKAEKVTRSVKRKISPKALQWMIRASLSVDPGAPDAIYRFLRRGFAIGASVTEMLTDPAVMRLMEINRRVSNEAHHFLEFARFSKVDGRVYLCHLEPKSDVIYMVAQHFADRMPSEHFMIIDDGRRTAVVHPCDQAMYLCELSDYEFDRLSRSELLEDDYTQMWRTFFATIAIQERINPACQNSHFPKWKRKHATEFMAP